MGRLPVKPSDVCQPVRSLLGKCLVGTLTASLFVASAQAQSATFPITQTDLDQFTQWGLAAADQIESDLGKSGSWLYYDQKRLDGGHGSFDWGFAWPMSTQLRVLTDRLALDPTNSNTKQQLRGFSDELHWRYWERSSDWQNGYVVLPGSLERFYDDNAHFTPALIEAYQLTGDSVYLDRAKAVHQFVLEGEVPSGGILFKEHAGGVANTVSTLQAARGAAMIHQVTGEQMYLDDAMRLMAWSEATVQQRNGMYYQDARSPIDTIANTPLTNAAGMGIQTNLAMYEITDDALYLTKAQATANSLVNRYFAKSNGGVDQAGYWSFEAVEALLDLYETDGDERWLKEATDVLFFLHGDVMDANGRFGEHWASSLNTEALSQWGLNEQAAAARVFLHAGQVTIPEPAALPVLLAGALGLMRRRRA